VIVCVKQTVTVDVRVVVPARITVGEDSGPDKKKQKTSRDTGKNSRRK